MCTKIHYSNLQVCFCLGCTSEEPANYTPLERKRQRRRQRRKWPPRTRRAGRTSPSGRIQGEGGGGQRGLFKVTNPAHKKNLKMTSQRDANTPNTRVQDTSAHRITHPRRSRRLSRYGAAPPTPSVGGPSLETL